MKYLDLSGICKMKISYTVAISCIGIAHYSAVTYGSLW
jgi:hypothetical protein